MDSEDKRSLTRILFRARPKKLLGFLLLLMPVAFFIIIPVCQLIYNCSVSSQIADYFGFGLLFFMLILPVYCNYMPYAIFDELMTQDIALRGLRLKNLEKSGRVFFRLQLVLYILFWISEYYFLSGIRFNYGGRTFFAYLLYSYLSPWFIRELTLMKIRAEFRKLKVAQARYQAILFYREAKIFLKQKLSSEPS